MNIEATAPVDKLTFARESLVDVWAELQPLLYDNHRESGALSELRPRFERYAALDEANHLFVFTMRKARRLVGYATFFISEHLHADQLVALQDVMFVIRQHRTRAVLRFVQWCDQQMIERGAKVILRHSGMQHRFGLLLAKLGYFPQEVTFMRRV